MSTIPNYEAEKKGALKRSSTKLEKWKGECACRTLIFPSNNAFSFTTCQLLTMSSPNTDNAKLSSNSLPQSGLSWAAEKANVCSFPSLLLSLPPSLSDLLPSFAQSYPVPPLCAVFSIANFSCIVYPHVRAWLSAALQAELHMCFMHVSCPSGRGGGALYVQTSVCRYAHMHVVAKLKHLYACVRNHEQTK